MSEMNSEMTDELFLMHVTNNLTSEYESQVDAMESRIGHDKDPLDIEELCEKLCIPFERLDLKDNHSDSDEEKDEKALFGATQFKGRCRQCKKYGLMGVDCCSKGGNGGGKQDNQSKSGNGRAKFTGTCNYCQKPRHKKIDCYKRKKEEGNGEKANNAADNKAKEDTAEVV
jgi:hypothetical protein